MKIRRGSLLIWLRAGAGEGPIDGLDDEEDDDEVDDDEDNDDNDWFLVALELDGLGLPPDSGGG